MDESDDLDYYLLIASIFHMFLPRSSFMSMHWGHAQNIFLFVFVPHSSSKFSVHPNTHLQMLTGLGACYWMGKDVKDPNV